MRLDVTLVWCTTHRLSYLGGASSFPGEKLAQVPSCMKTYQIQAPFNEISAHKQLHHRRQHFSKVLFLLNQGDCPLLKLP